MTSLLLAIAVAVAAEKTTDVCWGATATRCYSIQSKKVSEILHGSRTGSRTLDTKTEASLRKDVGSFTSWAESKKARVNSARARNCREVLLVRTEGVPTYLCLDALPKEELESRHAALLSSLRGGKR